MIDNGRRAGLVALSGPATVGRALYLVGSIMNGAENSLPFEIVRTIGRSKNTAKSASMHFI